MPEPQDRQIRVFISSTFRDMGAERDHLVKFIFPQLRKLCESRGVTWGEVDLRWGVTDEEAAEGKVLPICLEEIKRCRPYFIGILGERYGWVPETISEELIEREPWLKKYTDKHKSVTELEILHGVLEDPKMAGHAFFYFRDPACLDRLPIGAKRKDFITEDAGSQEKLGQLKAKIKDSGFPVRIGYRNPEVLGRAIRRDLNRVINKIWPEGSQLDPLDRDAMDHEAFARSRERVYIGREEYFLKLDANAAGNDGKPLVILGESGSGKSALLANWALKYRAEHPGDFLLVHFIGGTPYSSDWAAMLRRIMGEFKRKLGIAQDIPDQPDALRTAFANWLHMAAAKGRVILILDALNQLEDRDGAPDLVWLPPVMPGNVRLIVSTLPGRALEEVKKRQWPVLNVKPLGPAERLKLLWRFLRQFRKGLNKTRRRKIALAPQCDNPLFLRVLLEELRVFGEHERLDERITHYLSAGTVPELYEKILARWETDYGRGCNLVGNAMSLLWAARRGLSEAELLDALGKKNKKGEREPLPRSKWSPVFLAMDQALISRSGVLNFSHSYLRIAVERRYLKSVARRRHAHLNLADYFAGIEPAGFIANRFYKLIELLGVSKRLTVPKHLPARNVNELLWQLVKAESWHRLLGTFRNPAVFKTACETSECDVVEYWTILEKRTRFRANDFLMEMVSNKQADAHVLFQTAELAGRLSNAASAALAFDYLASYFERSNDRSNAQAALGNEARYLYESGQYGQAWEHFKNQEKIARDISHHAGLFNALTGLAGILHRTGRGLEIAPMMHEIRELAGSKPTPEAEAICANIEAALLICQHDFAGAYKKLKLAEQLMRAASMDMDLASVLANLSRVAVELEDWEAAEKAAEETMTMAERFNLPDLIRTATGVMASVAFFARHDLQKAFKLFAQQEKLFADEKTNPDRLSGILMQAACLMQLGREVEALPIMKRALPLAGAFNPSLVADIQKDITAIERQISCR